MNEIAKLFWIKARKNLNQNRYTVDDGWDCLKCCWSAPASDAGYKIIPLGIQKYELQNGGLKNNTNN